MEHCDHGHQELRHRESNNSYCMQCLECGKTFISIKHDDLSDAEKQGAASVDDSIAERYWQSRREVAAIESMERKQDWFRQHNDYLRSPEWKARRVAVFRRDGYVCQACLQNQASQVHHLTYDHWGDEPLFDLISVCDPCHERITNMDRARRGTLVRELQI